MSQVSVDMLSLNALVSLRIGDDGIDYPSRIEDLATDTVIVAAPVGANAALFETGNRSVQLSWVSPRGRYEQACELVEHISSRPRLWRLRPVDDATLIQRRRYVRARAAVPVLLLFPGVVVPGTTIDISEGGFRVRIARRTIDEMAPTTIHVTIAGEPLEIQGHVVRTSITELGQTEVVVAFEAERKESDAIRRFVFELQLRARAAMHG
jgi:c-di-GMP-binding flagellar brake protein YcgR